MLTAVSTELERGTARPPTGIHSDVSPPTVLIDTMYSGLPVAFSLSSLADAASRFFLPSDAGLGATFSGSLPKPLAIIVAGVACTALLWRTMLHAGLTNADPALKRRASIASSQDLALQKLRVREGRQRSSRRK